MKLVTYRLSGAEYVGALTADGKGVLPLPAADMNTLIETMTPADLRSAAAAAERGGAVPLADVELLAPIPRPRQDVVCLGMNYRDHAEESARYSADAFTKDSAAAVYFSKRVSEAGKPGGVIPRHAGLTDRLDYEAELAVVLGESAVSPTDRMYAAFAQAFEEQYISQGYHTDRSMEETLSIGWKLLAMLPKSELKRIHPEYLEQYLPKEGDALSPP